MNYELLEENTCIIIRKYTHTWKTCMGSFYRSSLGICKWSNKLTVTWAHILKPSDQIKIVVVNYKV